jgi:hypothetical protein
VVVVADLTDPVLVKPALLEDQVAAVASAAAPVALVAVEQQIKVLPAVPLELIIKV